MQFPLTLSFKILALAPQISVVDANGALQFYVRQKLLKLKEAVNVFADKEQKQLLYTIKANKVIDWSATYALADAGGKAMGSVSRKGMRSLWKAEYHITGASGANYMIKEENGWIKFLDGFVAGIPVVGAFTGYFLNPTYAVTNQAGGLVMRLRKQPAFFEGKFTIENEGHVNEPDATSIVLSTFMLLLLERARG